jgi:hypothetical protein
MLVCVYYRVAAGDAGRVISEVREFQRTLRPAAVADGAEVLLRCDLPLQASPLPPHDARAPSLASTDPPTGADATVMETYRLPSPAAGADADAAVHAFLATLETAALPIAALVHGTRHVELFAPCAS